MIHLTNNELICIISAQERFEFNLEFSCLSKRTLAIAISQYTLDLSSLAETS